VKIVKNLISTIDIIYKDKSMLLIFSRRPNNPTIKSKLMVYKYVFLNSLLQFTKLEFLVT